MKKNYDSISPSAKALLLSKALTDIPYAADAARLIWGNAAAVLDQSKQENLLFLMRLLHFEARYKSVDNMINQLEGNNIFELSSGYSFRGLNMAVARPDVVYIDTDLPAVIEDKLSLLNQLLEKKSLQLQGELILKSLNALDETEFQNIVNIFPPGPITIVNEGLLMYLNNEEKAQLCHIVRNILKERGGHWITADVYIKKDVNPTVAPDQFSQFLAAHNVEENKFDSYTQAEEFFNAQGLKIHRKAEPVDRHTLSALKYISPNLLQAYAERMKGFVRIRETWALKAV
ncbi:hypothetical protein C8P68_107208 [Mucilaginibacter yixingensis]|uniref:O-methyltransferase involved in polyketide biosynthesis n=1 Tax=Mucilaginibacter yixingensis TaxID=1295612 RepID=A0A2T5J6I4_9SPHI|nr:hypothetical protein [Mucilaginibacter yixingensis]PTQ94143.1 hypothetical protein C8P68_107208 [Mucilaginibacter yixingensis]